MAPVMTSKEFKIVILGGGGVGKSALTIRFCHNTFVEKYDPTIEDSYKKSILVDGVQCQCEILDTAGTEQFLALHTLYMKSGDGFVLVFSLNSMDSIKELQPIRENILRQKEFLGIDKKRVPFVLVGNKCDLVAERTVQREVGVALSRLWGGVPYYEASARREINVSALFEDIVRQVVKLDQEMNPVSNFNGPTRKKKKGKASCVIV